MLSLLRIVRVALALGPIAATAELRHAQHITAHAIYVNFATNDILAGHDGPPSHPLQPVYGTPTFPITVDGDGREQAGAHLTYFEGSYWMPAATWSCGGSSFVYGHLANISYPASPVYPPGDYGEDGNCGIKSYSSPNFTNWTLEDFYQPSEANVTKPLIRYSNTTRKYVLCSRGNDLNNIFYTTSNSPGGPWSNPLLFLRYILLEVDVKDTRSIVCYIW